MSAASSSCCGEETHVCDILREPSHHNNKDGRVWKETQMSCPFSVACGAASHLMVTMTYPYSERSREHVWQ